MSIQIGQLDIVAGVNRVFQAPSDGQKAILIGNESGLTCTITMEGGSVQKTLYPSSIDWFPVRNGFTGNILIAPQAMLSNVSSWPSSTLVFDAIGINDHESGTQYPVQLNRTANIGNTVPTTGGGSSTLQNDNNAALTQVIEATQTGSPSSNMSADNSGNFYLAQWVSATYTKIFQVIANGASVVKIGATGLLSEVLGSLKIDQNLTVVGTSSLDNSGITTDGAGNISKVGTIASGAITSSAGITGTAISGTTIAASGKISANANPTGIEVAHDAQIDNNCNVNANLQLGNLSSIFRLFAAIASDNNNHIYCNSDNNKLYATASNQTTNLALFDGANSLVNILQDFLLTKGKIGTTASADILDASSATATYLKSRNSGGSIFLQIPDGATQFTFDSTGKMTCNNFAISGAGAQFTFLAGNLSRVSAFTGTGSGTYNHNLGATPLWVGPIVSVAGSATQGWDSGNSTQVHVTLGASLAFEAFCIHQ